jgi:hypothetical protein
LEEIDDHVTTTNSKKKRGKAAQIVEEGEKKEKLLHVLVDEVDTSRRTPPLSQSNPFRQKRNKLFCRGIVSK